VFDRIEPQDLPEIDLDTIIEIEQFFLNGNSKRSNSINGCNGRNNRLKNIVTAMRSRNESESKIVREIYAEDRKNHKNRLFTDKSEGFNAKDELEAHTNAWSFVTNVTKSLIQSKVIRFKSGKKSERPKPTLNPTALFGLTGEYVRAIEPHTESDPAAILFQFLTAFGNVVGRNSYFQVERDKHYPNFFISLVGNTSKGRKGTSWGQVLAIFKAILLELVKEWTTENIHTGLSSGEGLVYQTLFRF